MVEYNKCVLEILTEEPSMEYFLRGILPQILPDDYAVDVNCFIRPHNGKSDLKRSIPKKMKAYPNFPYPVKALIIHDQDTNDCKLLKQELIRLCGNTTALYMVRIACKELENWYLGDMIAVESVYPETKAGSLANKAKYRNPDLLNGSDELEKMTKNFSKTQAAREIPHFLNFHNNKSTSFNHTIKAIRQLVENQ